MSADTRKAIAEFEAGDINVERFNHAEHIRMGWRYLATFGSDEGSTRFRTALQRLTRTVGAETKYHETITCIFLKEISDRLDGGDWPGFKAANGDLFNARAVLARHYHPETLASEDARRRFVPPDRPGSTDRHGPR